MSPSSPSSDSSTPARMAAYAGYWKRTQFSALSDLGATPSGTSLRSLPSRSSVLKSSSSYLERAQKEWPSARFAAEGHGVITVNTPNERMPTRVGTERPHPRRVSAVSVSDSDQATFSRSYASAISTKPLFVHSEKSGDRTVEDTIETARRLPAPHLVVKSLPSRSSSRIAEAAVGHVREDLTAAQGKGHERAVWKGTHWADAAATAGQRGPTSSPCKNRGGNKTSGHTPTHQACAEIVTKGDVPLTPEPSKGDCLSGVHHAKQSSFLELPDGEMCVLDSALPDTSGGRACSTQRQEGHRDYEVLDCLPPLLQNELPSKHELRELTALQRLAVLAGLLSLLVENSQGNFQLQLNRSSHLHQEERARIETIKRNQHRSERLSREVENIEAAIDAAWAEIGNTSAMASSNLGLACNLSGSQDSTRSDDLEIAAQPSQTGMSTQLATVNPPELTRGERRTSDLSKAALRMTNGSLSSVAVGTAVASETHVRTGADQTNRRISSAQRQGRQASASIAFEVAQRKLLGSLRNSLSASPSAATLIISMSSPLAGLPGTPGYTVEHEQELIGI
ncbi:unnamed protein product [Sympodiomycopsis kandeliae]